MIAKRIALLAISLLLVLPFTAMAVDHDWSNPIEQPNLNPVIEPIQNQHGDPSPSAINSQVDTYLYQDEQVNLVPDSGLVKVLRTNQKVNTNKFATDLLQFRNANPRELRAVIRTVCRKEGGNADVVQDREKKEFFMQVVCPEFQLPYLKAAAEELDVPWLKVAESGHGQLYYKCKFRKVADVNFISRWYRGPEGFFRYDIANNALYYDDQPAVLGLQKKGLSEIDIPPNQALFEVAIYEVSAQNDSKIGLDWMDWKNGPGRNLFEGIFSNVKSRIREKYELDDNLVSRFKWRGPDNDYRYINVDAVATTEFIDFLKIKGKAKEMTKTTLMAKSGQTVITAAVDKVVAINAVHKSSPADDETIVRNPVVANIEENSTGLSGVTNLPQQHNRFVNFDQNAQVGVTAAILPSIGLESMETAIILSASDVAGMDANGKPIINTRSISTKVRLKDGEPVVIGGLKRHSEVKRSAKVPVLGSIPVVGWLFGQETDNNREAEVVMVIKPKVIIGASSDLEIPQEAKTTIAMAKGEQPIEIPTNSWGFDQWLLDCEK
ncbi:MAG TPA: type II and III secretion system protein [Candidatus Sumerlaeota bacterium]|nr:type II and III secretion system protein [Candidatus Sumerlaeota bacterium]HRR30389.1 type II and III secretion system protein [Candidatus Sumerlaeia bacterium]HON51114.1 type II and III secretion system protein [Candidatus Sumerlaeota bacterium]HOR65007.1 type II and III secretion system protein [Candidatus Sumerlaeota bacterium]HPL74981.1 type II and III secretion system protein [Candidatus Sumerlaeota bacterium]